MNYYRAFGLDIASELPLPELARSDGSRSDVRITLESGDPPAHLSTSAGYDFTTEDAAFLVEEGKRIRIWPRPSRPREDISIWLLGTVMAALLHQRGKVTLHANCIEYAHGRALAVAGDSGAGKSSLAAMAAAAGYPVLGDDLLAVEVASPPVVHPGVLRLKCWDHDLALVDRSREGLEKVASDLHKYHVPLPPVEPGPRRLERLYLLERGETAFERLGGIEAAEALLANLYRFEVGQDVRTDPRAQFLEAMDLAANIEIWRFTRPWKRERMEASFAALEAHFRT